MTDEHVRDQEGPEKGKQTPPLRNPEPDEPFVRPQGGPQPFPGQTGAPGGDPSESGTPPD